METDYFEQMKLFLPRYLTAEQSRDLFSQLESFPHNMNYYLAESDRAKALQGDGLHGFVAVNFDSLEKKVVSGVIVSNSCDIDPENDRYYPINVLFAPIVRLNTFMMVILGDLSEDKREGILYAIRKQMNTRVFYLPEYPGIMEESIIFLDDIHKQPLENFQENKKKQIFRLNQYGFYIFVIKLSVHFTRLNEGIRRYASH